MLGVNMKEENQKLIDELRQRNRVIAQESKNGIAVLEKLESSDIGYLRWNYEVVLSVLECEKVLGSNPRYSPEDTLKLIENELKVRKLRGEDDPDGYC